MSLIAFALFGQLFLLSVLLLLLGGGGYLLLTAFESGWHLAWAIKLGIPMVLAAIATIWAVVQLKPDEGPRIVITREDDMPLWQMLDEMAEALQAPRVDRVNITPDFNASASRPARALPLPWPAPYVVSIGAPLLLLLDEEELKAVLAHELAHHSHSHTSISLMIWRSLANADATLETLNKEGMGLPGWLVEKFYRWYAPRLHEMALPYARRHEYEADASAAALVGPAVMARALAAVEGRAAIHYEMMRQLRRKTLRGEPLPKWLLTEFLEQLKRDHRVQARIPAWVQRALRRNTDDEDTHPCLRERLAAIGHPDVPPAALHVPARPAVHALFGKEAPRMLRAADVMVRDLSNTALAEIDARRRKLETQLKAAVERIQLRGYSTFLVSEVMVLLHGLERHEEILSLAAHLRASGRMLQPLHLFSEASARLEMGEAGALRQLLELAGRHPWLMGSVVSVASDWLDGDGAAHDTPELRLELNRMKEMDTRCRQAMREHDRKLEVLSPEGFLAADELQEIREQLEARRRYIGRAWLVARRCERMPGWVQVEIALRFRLGTWLIAKDAALRKAALMMELNDALPYLSKATQGLTVIEHGVPYAFTRQVRKVGMRLI